LLNRHKYFFKRSITLQTSFLLTPIKKILLFYIKKNTAKGKSLKNPTIRFILRAKTLKKSPLNTFNTHTKNYPLYLTNSVKNVFKKILFLETIKTIKKTWHL